MTRENRPIEAEPLDAHGPVTLRELCRACEVDADSVIEHVELGVIEPQAGRRPHEWRFPPYAVVRLRRAVRLRRDLSVDPNGAALALDLLEQVEALRQRLRRFE